jgi:hypothetical protein
VQRWCGEADQRGLARNRPILIIPKHRYPVWLAWRIAPTAMTAHAARG